LIWADIAIVISIVLFMWGGSSDSLWGEDKAWFIENELLLIKVNVVGMFLFVVGLSFQDYSPSIESNFKILFQIVAAFARVFGFA